MRPVRNPSQIVCKICQIPLIVGENWNPSGAKNKHYFCRPHATEYQKQHAKKTLTREELKERHLQQEYQIGRPEWEKMYAEQNGKCRTCGKPLADFSGQGGAIAAVDHDHHTGLIRGLLCMFPCNHLLGFTRDNPTLCRAMADYIEDPPATHAFGGPRYTFPGEVGTKKRRALMKKAKKLSTRI